MPDVSATFGIDTSPEGLANTAGQLANYLDPSDTQKAMSAIQNLPAGTVDSVMSIATTGKVSMAAVGPLLAAGLAATGVGAPAAAIVAVGLPIVQSIGDALGLFGGQKAAEHFDWYAKMPGSIIDRPEGYGRNGPIPYGPSDPLWIPIDKASFINAPPFFGESSMVGNDLFDLDSPDGGKFGGRVGPRSGATPQVWPPEARQFARVFAGAWKMNAEKVWNGHKGVADATLLAVAAAAWNRAHSPSKTFTILPQRSPYAGDADSGISFIAALLGGMIDGANEPPLTLNIGPVVAQPARKVVLTFPHQTRKIVIPLHLGLPRTPVKPPPPISLVKRSNGGLYALLAAGTATVAYLATRKG